MKLQSSRQICLTRINVDSQIDESIYVVVNEEAKDLSLCSSFHNSKRDEGVIVTPPHINHINFLNQGAKYEK